MQIVTMPIPAQDGITRDNVTVRVDAVVYFRVIDPVRAIVDVQDYISAVGQVAQTSLRSIIGKSDLDDLLSNRERLNQGLELMIDSPALGWGVQIDRVEIKDVALPESMKRSMSRQAEAERERRARVISADGELQASEKLALAAAAMASHPAALQLRLLETVVQVASEKNSTLVLPFPVELLRFLERSTPTPTPTPTPRRRGHHGCCGGTGGVGRSPADRRRLERDRAGAAASGNRRRRSCRSVTSRSSRGGQQRADLRVAAAELAVGLHRVDRAAAGEQPRRNASPFARSQPAVLVEPLDGVGVEHLAPDVGVVAGAVAAGEDVGEVGACGSAAARWARPTPAVASAAASNAVDVGAPRVLGRQPVPRLVEQGRGQVLGRREALAEAARLASSLSTSSVGSGSPVSWCRA